MKSVDFFFFFNINRLLFSVNVFFFYDVTNFIISKTMSFGEERGRARERGEENLLSIGITPRFLGIDGSMGGWVGGATRRC